MSEIASHVTLSPSLMHDVVLLDNASIMELERETREAERQAREAQKKVEALKERLQLARKQQQQ